MTCLKAKPKNCLKECLQSIEDNAFYINKIVTDLQDFAKPMKPSLEETDLTKIVDDVFSALRVPENTKTAYSIEPFFKKIVTDPSAMKRILQICVQTQFKPCLMEGRLTLDAVQKDDKIIICVADTGLGISPETMDKLFKPLFTTKSKGQGFGLAVVKKLTEALNGKVSVDSEVGKGTRFTLEFPLAKLNPAT